MSNQIGSLKTSKKSVFDVFLRFDNIQDWPCQTNNKLNDSSSIPAISTSTLADISKLSPMPVPDKNESLSETKRDATDYNFVSDYLFLTRGTESLQQSTVLQFLLLYTVLINVSLLLLLLFFFSRCCSVVVKFVYCLSFSSLFI